MARWLPYPRAALVLWLAWLLLAPAPTAGAVLLGGLLALVLPRTLAALEHPGRGARRPLLALRLAGRVALDIARSNLAVARILLAPRMRPRRAGFVHIPLKLRNPNALAVLACIITATPGTIWVSWSPFRHVLIIHVLDLVEEAAWIATIQRRYEAPLLEIFE